MSDSSNSNKYYVPTPIAADYEAANSDILNRASKFGIKSHRLLSAKGDRANQLDQGATNFRFLEDSLFSNKNVKLSKNNAPSMFETDYIQKMKNIDGCVYKALRFDRSHNIRSFDFIITYTQLNGFGAETYKPVLLTKQFKGSLLFTGCSIVRDTDTMEELPLKLYGKYESIGDTINNALDLDANENAKGGPTIKVKYTFDANYVYLFVSSISPFRLIPVGDGEFIDISYTEGRGSLIGESKDTVNVTSNPITGAKKTVSFSTDNRVWCDLVLSLKDTTISHDINNAEFVDFDDETMNSLATNVREQEVVFVPTNDGEQIVIGMEPSSTVNLEIAPDIRPIRFGSDLLNTSKVKIANYIEKLKNKITNCGTNIEKVPFSIKTSIRTKGKYNINGNYFVDSQADSFGNIIINDVGVYDAITGTFDITEYIFDKNQTKYTKLDSVKNYKEYKDNASDYLTSISAVDETTGIKPKYKSVRKTSKLLDILSNIEFENPNELDVYFNVAFVKNTLGFTVVAAYAEFGEYDDENADDYIVYICSDNKIRIVNFKDYDMENIRIIDLTTRTSKFTNNDSITKIDRSDVDGAYKYYIGTNNGLVIVVSDIINNPTIDVLGAFEKNCNSTEEVTLVNSDDLYVYIGGADGNASIIVARTDSIKYLPSNFKYGDSVIAAKIVDEDHIVFISKKEICSFSLASNKWNYEGDAYRTRVLFDNPYTDIPKPNLDYIIDENGWIDVPVVQKGNMVYALGMRYDSETGYTGVYKKLNILTGEVKTLPMPSEDSRVYKGKLCVDGRYIYSVGGLSIVHENDPLETRLGTYISVFDTITDEWIVTENKTVELGNGIILDESNGYYPVARKGKIYVIHPKTNQITLNENTNAYIINTRRIYKSYEISVFDDNKEIGLSVVELSSEINSKFVELDINIVPLISLKNEIHFFSGHPDTTGNQFNGYNLEKYVFDFTNNTVTLKTTKIGTEYELSHNYDEGKYSNAPSDLFGNFSSYSEDEEALVLLLERYCLYIYSSGINILYCEIHAVYHNITDNAKFSYLPLISSGEYNAWKKYGKTKPSNVNLIKNDNCVYFLGGTADRVPDVLSLDSMSLIPAPRYFERLKGTPESAVLANSEEVLKVVPIDDNFTYDEMSSVLVGNRVYLLAINKDEDYKAILMRYEMDNSASKLVVVADLTNVLASNEYKKWNKVSMTYIPGTDVIVFATVNGFNNNNESVSGKFSAIAYNFANNTYSSIISDDTVFANSKVIYPFYLPGKTSVVFVSDTNVGYKIDLLASVINVSTLTDSVYGFTNLSEEVNTLRFAKSVNYGNKVFFAVAKNNKVELTELEVKTGINKSIISLPNSANYEYPDIFRCNDDIYLTKGINGSNIGIDIFKINNGKMQHALLGSPSSAIIAPMAVSKKGNLYVFGFGRTSESVLRVLESKTKDDTFIDFNTVIDINSTDKSEYNRYNPNFTTTMINGHELLLVFGGTQSLSVPTTSTIDVFDVNKHMWSQPVVLPTKLSHLSIIENEILGATEEITSNAGKITYPKKLVLNCQNYDTLRFEIVEQEYPALTGLEYPVFGKYALNKTRNVLYIVDTLENGCIRNDISERAIYRIDLDHGSYSKISNLPEMVYSEISYVIGALVAGDSLVVATYSFTTNSISVFSYNENIASWGEIKKIPLLFTPTKKAENDRCIVANLSIFNNTFNAIKNNTAQADSTKAIISLLSNNEVYGIYISYKNNVTVSDVIKIQSLPEDSVIDSIYVSSKGFVYASDRETNKTYRCYPNNDDDGFGIKSLDIIDPNKTAIAKCLLGLNQYTLYENGDISLIDISKGLILKKYSSGTDTLISRASLDTTEDKLIAYFCDSENKVYKLVSDLELQTITQTECENVDSTNITDLNVFGEEGIIVYGNTIKTIPGDISIELNDGFDYRSVGVSKDNTLLCVGFDPNNKKIITLFANANETDRIIIPFDYDAGKWFFVKSSIYHIDVKGKVFLINVDLINCKFTYCGYVAKTDYSSNVSSKILTFNDSLIFDTERGISFSKAYTIDNDHYCFNESALNYNNEKIITLIKAADEETYICVHDYYTHKMINRCKITDELIDSTPSDSFVCKSNSVLKYCSITDGKIQIIDASTGNITILNNSKLKQGKIVNYIPHNNKFIVGNDDYSYLVFDPMTLEISEVSIDFKNYDELKLKEILYSTRYAEFIFALFIDKNDYVYLGRIYKQNKLLLTSATGIKENIKTVSKVNDGFLAKSDNKLYKFTVDEFNSKIIIRTLLSSIDTSVRNIADHNSLFSFNLLINRRTGAYVTKNGYVVASNVVDGLTDVEFKEFGKYVLICGKINSESSKLCFINTVSGKEVNLTTDFVFTKFEYADIDALFDSVIEGGITRLGHIVGIVNGELRSFSIKISDSSGHIKEYSDYDDTGISIVANDDNIEHPIVSERAVIVPLQNRFIGVFDNEKLYLYTLSAAWRLVFNEINISLDNPIMNTDFHVIKVGDLIYIINKSSKTTVVMCVPYEGLLVNIVDGYNFKEVILDDQFYNIISNIPTGKALIADNTRICKLGKFGVYFNTLSNCAEYYNRFIGVDGSGEAIDNIVPISEYEISFITVSDETNISALRSNENIKTVIRMIYKSSGKNIVSEISAISRLNTAKFRVLYSKTNDDEIGEIYAFTDVENNGTLVRDDTSYYRGDYSAVIINNSIIKINVDGEIYTYLRANNEIPLYNQILPIVIIYGERENSNGNTEARYLSFVDMKGNLVTYDKELKSFIDISGYVDVEIPFFSTEAIIYPSKCNSLNTSDALVEENVKSTE